MKKGVTFLIVILSVISSIAQEIDAGLRPKVGLVLSGGGAKGFAHIGVLRVIEETGVKIDYIAGTSMGAVVGGLYAADYSANEIDSIITSLDFMNLVQDKIPRNQSGFFEKQHGEKDLLSFPVTKKGKITLPGAIASGQAVYSELNALFEHVNQIDDFNELPIPFFCMATDLESGKSVLLNNGSLAEAIRASASLPTLLEPFAIGDNTYIDGGLTNNFPVDEMKARGATIIIGVDVQGKLDKKEDINSVVEVLNQIVNYQMYARDDEKLKKLSVHIKPNTAKFSITSFDDSPEIIEEGQRVAEEYKPILEEVAMLQVKFNKPENNSISKEKRMRKISRVKINHLENYSGAYIRGKMDLQIGDSVTYDQLNKKIQRLSADDEFDMITYKFNDFNGKEDEVQLEIKENEHTSAIKLGVHFDPLYKSSLLLNFTTKHLLIKNDILSANIISGDNPRVNLNYFVNNGIYTSYGFNSRYNSLKTNVSFDGEQVNQINKNFIDVTTEGYVQTTFNRMFAVGLGLEHKYLKVSTKALVIEDVFEDTFVFDDSHYFNSLLYIKYDSYDKIAFPKNGWFVDGELKYYMESIDFNENFAPFVQFKLKLSGVKTLFNKLSFHPTVEGGVTFENNNTGQFEFALGGFGENMINNHIPFYGYEYEDKQNHSYLKGAMEVRYEVFKKHSLAFILNYGKTDLDVINGGKVFEDVLSGYAVVYGYESFLGPVKLVKDWSPDTGVSNWYLSVGFWF